MILLRELVAWRRHAPWPKDFQIEQDLLLTRAMAAIFSDDFLSGQVAMRGGTVLHKIHLAPAARYSEDVDLVLVGDRPEGHIQKALRRVLKPVLGAPRSSLIQDVKLTVRNLVLPSRVLRQEYCYAPLAGPGTCVVFNAALGIGRCDNVGGCAPAGEICEPGTNECCPGNPEGQAFCQPGALGVLRCQVSATSCKPAGSPCDQGAEGCSGVCTDKTCGAPACIPDGEPCAFGDQCCGKICAPDPTTGALVCSPACIQPGQGCTTHADCCDGYCDPKTLTCGQPPSGCVPLGGSCKVNTDCCSGGCVGSVCIPAPR
jgi:hypothetical protein